MVRAFIVYASTLNFPLSSPFLMLRRYLPNYSSKINPCLKNQTKPIMMASVWNTDLMKAVLVKQSSFQALS